MMVGIPLGNGAIIPVDFDDLAALIEFGLLEVTERDETGKPIGLKITQDGYDCAEQLDSKETGGTNDNKA
jgi:hypothetical protein